MPRNNNNRSTRASRNNSRTSSTTTSAADYHLQTSANGAVTILQNNRTLTFSFDDDDDDSIFFRRQQYLSPAVRATLEESNNNPELSEHDKIIIQRLAMRSFHLPGNSFWEDWHAFLWNNHPVFGLTSLADKRHPFGFRERLINLIASLAFGLAATSSVVLWYYYHNRDMNQVLYTFGHESATHFDVTHGLVALLIFGGFLHVVFDFGLWFLQACPCCREGGFCMPYLSDAVVKVWLWLGSHLALEVTIISIILSVYVIVLRASLQYEEEEELNDDQLARIRATGIEDYAFLLSYVLEVVVSLFILFPICAFTIFSGVLGCGVVPGIGGRPFQKKRWKMRQERLQKEQEQEMPEV